MIRNIISITLAIFICGCSGSESVFSPENPVVPDTPAALTGQVDLYTGANRGLWALGLIYADITDPAEPFAEFVPVRSLATHFNVLTWLENGPCTDCLEITGITPSGSGTILVDIRLTHPFSNPNLTGFDVRGIAMFDGSRDLGSYLKVSDRTLGDGQVMNPDGYTMLYSGTITTGDPNGLQIYQEGRFSSQQNPDATLNAYKRFISDDPGNTRNAFYAGDEITVTYEIDMPGGQFIFGYGVDACWAKPSTKPVTDPMEDFGINANCPEPWKIEATVTPVGLGFTNSGGQEFYQITVWDYEGGVTHDQAIIGCKELLGAGNQTSSMQQATGSGYTYYTAYVQNSELAPVGEYLTYIEVYPQENATAPGWMNLKPYQLLWVDVIEFVSIPPVAIVEPGPEPYIVCEDIPFSGSPSFDEDGGAIVLYEWDWDNDGTYDEQGENVTHSWTIPGEYPIQLRVTDDESETDTLDEPFYIGVGHNPPTAFAVPDNPTPNVGDEVTFDASGSTDNDCSGNSIVEYLWESEFGAVTTAIPELKLTFNSEGLRALNLRVTDDEGGEDWLDADLEIEVQPLGGWVRTWGSSPGSEIVYGVDKDAAGNIWCAGTMGGDVDLDPGPGEDFHTAYYNDGFVVKLDSNGFYQWGFNFGDPAANARVRDIAVTELGFGYIAGAFDHTVDFDPGPGTENRTASFFEDVFLMRFNTETGDMEWVIAFGDTGYDHVGELEVDDSGNAYLCGTFAGTVDFDTGTGTWPRASIGSHDSYIASYSPEGSIRWARAWGSADYEHTDGLCVANATDLYVTGGFSNTVDFEEGAGTMSRTSNGLVDVYLCRYSTDGLIEWVVAWGGSETDYGHDVDTDEMGRVFVTGGFEGLVDFDPDPADSHNQTSMGADDAYLSVFDTTGDFLNVVVWQGTGQNGGSRVEVNPEGWTYVTGVYADTVDFDPSGGEHFLTSNGFLDGYVSKFTPSQDWQWTASWGGTGSEWAQGLHQDPIGNVYITGSFQYTVDFDPTGNILNVESEGWLDGYLLKIMPDGSW